MLAFYRPAAQSILETNLISLLDLCKTLKHIEHVHAYILRKGLDQNCFIITKVLRMLTNIETQVEPYSRLIFNQVKSPNSFLWTAIIRGYAIIGPQSEALVLYDQMRKNGTLPISYTFSALFKACSGTSDANSGLKIHGQTFKFGGLKTDLYVNNTLIEFYVKMESLGDAKKVFDEMPERDVISWTSLIVAYARKDRMEMAEELFEKLPEKDMVAWTAMITGCTQNARPKDALKLFERMREARVEIDRVSLVGLISACAQLGTTKYASWIRTVARSNGCSPDKDVVVGSALIDMYAKCGCLDEASKVFDEMSTRNVYSYSAMIAGFAMHGKAKDAIDLFEKMTVSSIKPNRVTIVGVLSACSHVGYVDYGRRIFANMEKDYGVSPSIDHYACMVDLLGRSGCVEEAYDLIKSMTIEPHGGVWGALLGACRIHNKPNIAEKAAQKLFEIEPQGIGNYVLLSNIYARAGKWDHVLKVRNLMRKRGLKKNPACSWVETHDGVVHEFFAGHLDNEELTVILEGLLEKLKKMVGYIPNLNCVVYDVSEIEKERLLKAHSEKLALAFALLRIPQGDPIRIVKNLRMCEDCHTVLKGASGVERRGIIVRDNMRFHHFKEGICSCGDFW